MYNHLNDHHHINSHPELKGASVAPIKHVDIAAMLTLMTTRDRKLQRCYTVYVEFQENWSIKSVFVLFMPEIYPIYAANVSEEFADSIFRNEDT